MKVFFDPATGFLAQSFVRTGVPIFGFVRTWCAQDAYDYANMTDSTFSGVVVVRQGHGWLIQGDAEEVQSLSEILKVLEP